MAKHQRLSNEVDDSLELVGLRTRYEPYKYIPVGLISDRYCIQHTERGRPIYVPFIDGRGIDYIAALAIERLEHQYDCVIGITGQRRTGKTSLALQIAQKIDARFPIDNLAFRYETFKKLLKENPWADPTQKLLPQIILDESGFDLFAKDWMKAIPKDATKVLQVIGAKNFILYFNVPHKQKLISDIRDEMWYIWLDVNPSSKFGNERGYTELRYGNPNKFHQAEYWEPLCAFWSPKANGPLWDTYQQRKHDFIDGIFDPEPSIEPSPRIGKTIKQRDSAIRAWVAGFSKAHLPIPYAEITRATGLSKDAISHIVNNEASP